MPDPTVIVQGPVEFPPFWVTMDPRMIVFVALGLFAATAIILYPIMRALGRRLEGRTAADPALLAEVEQLRQRVAELESMQHRMAELEERVDFAERLLARQRETESLRLPGS